MVEITLLADCKNHLGESPVWDAEEPWLYWVDSTGCEIWRCREDGRELETLYVPDLIGTFALREKGGAVLALANGFHFYDLRKQKVELIANPLQDLPDYRFNDGKVDRAGRLFSGCMGYDFERPDVNKVLSPAQNGPVFRLDPDLSVHRIDEGMGCFNAPCWSPDNRTFYYGDTEQRTLWASDYDIATGEASNRRVFASDAGFAGLVDGATVDREGYVWNAKVLGGRLVRYAPDGSVDRVIQMPVRNVTSVAFGGPDMDVLFVTSMGKPVRGIPNTQKGAGGLFAVKGLGVQGIPEPRFAG